MPAYVTESDLEDFLGRALTAEESSSATLAGLAATDWIDRYLGMSWQGATITGELHTVTERLVTLDRTPVSTVTTVTARSLYLGDTPRVLVAGIGYELLDALNGTLLVAETVGTVLSVTYTVGSVVPSAVKLAAMMIATSYVVGDRAASSTERGIQKLKAGSAEITYDPISTESRVPASAIALLDGFRPPLVFA